MQRQAQASLFLLHVLGVSVSNVMGNTNTAESGHSILPRSQKQLLADSVSAMSDCEDFCTI